MVNKLSRLRQLITNHFNEEELRTLCFDLNVDYDSLPARGKAGKARELLLYLGHRRRLDRLLARLVLARPNLSDESTRADTEALEALYADLPSFEDADLPALPAPGESPFKGMQYFDQADAHLFFGREALTAKLVGRLRAQRFLAVVGASGSGKSSVVRAGLIPALERGEPLVDGMSPPDGSASWPVHVITPTAHPLKELAASLTRDSESVTATATLIDDLSRDARNLDLAVSRLLKRGGRENRLLLVVDQFEELFTACKDTDERQVFVDNLLTAVSPETGGPTVLVIALRPDFYAYCAQYDDLREMLARCQEYIGPMGEDELRQAIEEPATRNGWEFEPGLVDLLLRDVGDEPGALPLLSHALLETWQRRQGQALTLEGYHEAGGVHGAIAKTAETVYRQKLTPEQQPIARNIFLRLTELGEGTQDTRRRAALAELIARPEDSSQVDAVLKTLADARLVTTSEDVAEVAHEALIREWPTLRGWLDENREGLRVHRHLTESAQDWRELNRDPGELYRSVRLAQVLDWAESLVDELNPLEREFLDASQMAVEKAEQKREAARQSELTQARALAEEQERRAEEQAQFAKRLGWLAATLVVVFLLAVGAAVIAEIQRREAQTNAQIALSHQLAVQAVNQLNENMWELAMLLAIEAGRMADTSEVFAAIRQVFAHPVRTLTVLSGHADDVNQAVWNADASRILTASDDGTARVWDARTEAELLTLSGHTDMVWQAEWNADESYILTSSFDGTARVWDAETGEELLILFVRTAAWNADESRILTTGTNDTARVWNARTGEELITLSGHTGRVNHAEWNADESRILTASDDGTARVWDAETGEELLTLFGHAGGVLQTGWNADASRILTTGWDGIVRVWNVETGEELLTLPTHESFVNQVGWNADESRILTANDDGTARVWDAGTGKELLILFGHESFVNQAVWNADESRILTAGWDGTARVWDAETGEELLTLSGHTGWVNQAEWNADESHIVTAGCDRINVYNLECLNGTARVWDAGMGEELLSLSGHTGWVNQAEWNTDESRILTAGNDGTARVWDAGTGKELLTLLGHTGWVFPAEWNADESYILTAGWDGTARVWNAETGKELLILSGHTGEVNQAEWSADESRILTASRDGTARVWDARTGAELLTLSGHSGGVSHGGWNADGSHILTVGCDRKDNMGWCIGGTARVWDAETGEELLILSGHTNSVLQAEWNTDESRILTASSDGTARVWDTRTGVELLVLSGHAGGVLLTKWNTDESRILTASYDGTARVWDAGTGKELLTLLGHTGWVLHTKWNTDESRILTASDDGTARVWDAETGEELFTLFSHAGGVNQAEWNADESRILTASWDGTARLWYTRMDDLLDEACQQAPRNMTQSEWRRFMKDEPYRETCPGKLVPDWDE